MTMAPHYRAISFFFSLRALYYIVFSKEGGHKIMRVKNKYLAIYFALIVNIVRAAINIRSMLMLKGFK